MLLVLVLLGDVAKAVVVIMEAVNKTRMLDKIVVKEKKVRITCF
jgi:hypothetical protein